VSLREGAGDAGCGNPFDLQGRAAISALCCDCRGEAQLWQAAIELGLWEPTISRGIRDLEDEIGVVLFIRHPGGLKLTNASNLFCDPLDYIPTRLSARHIRRLLSPGYSL
jgi:hypothetical protein